MKVDLSKYVNRHSGGSKAKRLLWEIVWACLARPTPRWTLNGWRCWLLKVFGAKLGKGCRVQGRAEIWQPWKLTLGENCWIDGGARIYSADEITLGANCVVSAGAFLCTASHDLSSPVFELVTKPVRLGDCAWAAGNATILPGVTLGEGAVAAAGAVVAKDVPPWTVVAGNPAREIGRRDVHWPCFC